MQAIETKYIAPTNTRGARVKATAEDGSVTVAWDDALDIDDNHQQAAKALATKLGWSRRAAHGVLPNGSHVWIPLRAMYELREINSNGTGP